MTNIGMLIGFVLMVCGLLMIPIGLMFTKFEAEKVGITGLRIALIGSMLTVINACVCLF